MIDKSELKFKVNRDIYNLDDFKPYLAEGKSLLSENGARRMIHKNTGEIVYFKPLLFQEFIASQITHAIFPNHTVVCGIGYKNNEEDFKEYYLYSKSPLNDGVDTRKFLDEYQSPIKHLNYGIKAEGLQFAVFALNLLLNDCDYNGNIIVHDGKAIRIDYDGLFEFENISNGDDITISQPKLLNSYMLTISNAVRAGAKLEVSDLQSALESCVELLKHINSDSRKILNKFFLEAYKFGLEINVFSSDKEMHDELLQYKSNFYILHPKNIDRLELFIEKLNEFNTIYDIKFITPPDAKPLNYNKDFLEFIINNLSTLKIDTKNQHSGDFIQLFQDYQKDCASHFDYVIHPAIICEAFGFEIDGLSTFKWFENKGYNINELIAEYHNDRVQFFSTDPYPGSNDPNAENIPFPNIDLALLANKNRLLSEYPEYPEFKSLIAELEHDYPVFDADFQFISD